MNTHCYNIENTCQYYKYLGDYGACALRGGICSSPLPEFELTLTLDLQY